MCAAATVADGRAEISFEVSDTGIGIDAAARERLFMPFTQADPSISRRFGGTGLGLAITRHLVTLMGGEITLDSESGKGTTIRFKLPYDVVEVAGRRVKQSNEGRRFLIVDDREICREAIALNLTGLGEPSFADSAEAALAVLEAAARDGRPFDAAVIDRAKAKVDSFGLCRRIRSVPALNGLAIVMIVSINWRGDAEIERELGSTALLTKPVRRKDMRAAIRRCYEGDGRAADAAGESDEFDVIAATRARVAGMRILLAEDNPVNQEVAKEYLQGFGCVVDIAENGLEAVAAYDRTAYDMILMDCQMPELDGLSATRRIRESESRLKRQSMPIIAVTANAYESDRIESLEAGMNDHLNKPFSEIELAELLTKWMPQSLVGGHNRLEVDPVPSVVGQQVDDRLDDDLLRVLLKSRPEFLGRLLKAFAVSTSDMMKQMQETARAGDLDHLSALAHGFKSACANIGARRLAELAGALEARAKDGGDAAGCLSLVELLRQELSAVNPSLKDLMEQVRQSQAA